MQGSIGTPQPTPFAQNLAGRIQSVRPQMPVPQQPGNPQALQQQMMLAQQMKRAMPVSPQQNQGMVG